MACTKRLSVLAAILPAAIAFAEPRPNPPAPGAVAMATGDRPRIVSITNLATGQTIFPGGPPAPARGQVVAFDNLSSPNSSAMVNVAYQNPGSYDGSNPSTLAFFIGLAERQRYVARSDQAQGFPAPTDIVWDDYAAGADAWPGPPESTATLLRFGYVLTMRNTDSVPPAPRTDTLRIMFFSSDHLIAHAGFSVVYNTPINFNQWFPDSADVSQFSPPLLVPSHGLVMLDFTESANSGVGTLFAGGDLTNPDVPRPETLWTVGSTDVNSWFFADGIVGAGGLPAHVDPAFDGDPSSVSYLDILNTGALANWQYTLVGPPMFTLPHDLPFRIVVDGAPSPPACPCDINQSGSLNSQDFFDFLTGFFAGQADFNHSGQTNSQDFFDFLICFFAGC